jgi:hypothetical protein
MKLLFDFNHAVRNLDGSVFVPVVLEPVPDFKWFEDIEKAITSHNNKYKTPPRSDIEEDDMGEDACLFVLNYFSEDCRHAQSLTKTPSGQLLSLGFLIKPNWNGNHHKWTQASFNLHRDKFLRLSRLCTNELEERLSILERANNWANQLIESLKTFNG